MLANESPHHGKQKAKKRLTCAGFDSPEVFLDEDGALERAFWLLLSGAFRAVPRLLSRHLLLLHANQHFGEEVALELLPRLAVLANADNAVQPKLAEPIELG